MGWFVVGSVNVLGEDIGSVVIRPAKPHAIISDSIQKKVSGVIVSCFDSYGGLNWVLSFLDDVWLLQPSF